MGTITRREIMEHPERWVRYINSEGKEVFREKKQFGNRHAIFEINSEIGMVHNDLYNATDVPFGTVNHIAKWSNEKFGINEDLARLLVWGIGIYATYKVGKHLAKSL
jgi:hypothetical protein